jgi:L-alanine-DL-glutamate epimerase-like enolase superfamily enzyme
MKITRVEAIVLRVPESHVGPKLTVRYALVIKVHTDEGIVGVGDVDSCPSVIKAIVEAPLSFTPVSGLGQLLVGENPLDIRKLNEKMYRATIDYGRSAAVMHAIGGIDIALWDIAGKYHQQPVYQLLGGLFHKKLRAYASTLFGRDGNETTEIGQRWTSQGFTAVKFGWDPMGQSQKLDLELVEGARRGVGDKNDVMIDAGCCWDTVTAIKRAQQFQDYKILWLEEPLARDNIEGYGQLTGVSRIPIAGGEGEAGRHAWRNLIERGGIHIGQIDIARNGLTETMRIADMAEDHGLRVINHFWSTGIHLAAGLHFLAARKSTFILEYCVEDSPLRWDVTQQKMAIDAQGFVQVPEGPGLGVDLDEETIERYRVEN